MKNPWIFLITILVWACGQKEDRHVSALKDSLDSSGTVSLVILGTIQDAGSPHIACNKDCCSSLFSQPDPTRKVVSLGLIDRIAQKTFLFEATPDITSQVKRLKKQGDTQSELPNAIFLSHAHIGHYSGLMYLGKEATNASQVPVYAMPRMKSFLETNGPWNQLVDQKNINIQVLEDTVSIQLTEQIKVTPFQVPHRDEYSETVGYRIEGPTKKVLFIPDIDKWEKWSKSITKAISEVDIAFIDATFFDGVEINNRSISEIPHPFIIESMKLFNAFNDEEKDKIYFIHFNHTNPVLDPKSKQYQSVISNGFHIAKYGEEFLL